MLVVFLEWSDRRKRPSGSHPVYFQPIGNRRQHPRPIPPLVPAVDSEPVPRHLAALHPRKSTLCFADEVDTLLVQLLHESMKNQPS